MIDLRYVKKLIDMIDGSTVDSLEISSDKGMKIRISKSPSQRGTVQMTAPMQMPSMVSGSSDLRLTPPQGVPSVVPEPEPEPAPRAAPVGIEVTSPMVGTYYHAPEPGTKPYVSVGTRVSKGQILCIIEAMKIMNEIESEHAGVVKEILVEDSQPVEYGQTLFRIDPNG